MSTTTKAAHTTSPWIVEAGKGLSGDNWLVCSVGNSSEDGLDYYVTTDHVRASELSGDAKYDARLISAAPELLRAAEITALYLQWVAHSRNVLNAEGHDALVALEAAIKKARGEQ